MIEQFFRPASVDEASRLKNQYGSEAVFMAGGSKLNATPTRTAKTIAISVSGLGLTGIEAKGGQLHIGATATLQQLIDSTLVPSALREAAGFVYSRNVRNQATIGGEISAVQAEAVLLPILLVMDAKVALADGRTVYLEDYLDGARDTLVTAVILPQPALCCATRKIARSAAGLSVVIAAVALAGDGQRIAIDGVLARPARLHEIEKRGLTDVALELAVGEAVAPVEDVRGSVAYKRYIAGVVVADLLADCVQMKKEI